MDAKTEVEEIRDPRVRNDLEKPVPKIIPVDMKMYDIPIEGIVTSTKNQSNKNSKKTKIVQEKSIIDKNKMKLEDDPAQFDAKMKELDAMTEELKKAQISLKDVSEKPKKEDPLKEKVTEKQETDAPKTNTTKPTKNLQPQPQKHSSHIFRQKCKTAQNRKQNPALSATQVPLQPRLRLGFAPPASLRVPDFAPV